MGYYINNEKLEQFTIIGMILAFGGVCSMSWSAMQEKKKLEIGKVEDPYAGTKFFGMMLELMAAFTYSVVTNASRRLQPVNPFVILFYFGCIGLVCCLLILFVDYTFFAHSIRVIHYPTETILYAIAGGLFDTGSAICVTIAYARGATGFVAMLGYVAIVWAFFSDVFIFHEEFVFDQLLSALFVVAVIIYTTYLKIKKSYEKNDEEALAKTKMALMMSPS